MERIKQSTRGIKDTDKWFSIVLLKSYKERRESGSKVIFEEMMAEFYKNDGSYKSIGPRILENFKKLKIKENYS